MFDLKTIHLVLTQLEEEKGISRERTLGAIEEALASAYKKEFGKRGQLVRAKFNLDTGAVDYEQVKIAVDPEKVIVLDEEEAMPEQENLSEEERKIRFNPEQHLLHANAKLIKADVQIDEELVFPLESKTEFSRVAAMAAKQVIMQQMRSAEKEYLAEEFGSQQGQVVSGEVERVERGTVFVNINKAEGIIPYGEQIKSERFKTGDRIRAYLFSVEDSGRGIFLKLSRTHPELLRKLFEQEVPELQSGTVEMKFIAREPGFRSKVAVVAHDDEVDPIGALVGQNGSRVSTVTSELSGERVDIIEWSEDTEYFVKKSLSPAEVLEVSLNEEEKTATVKVGEDQYSLAIGRGGQNVRLAAKLTGYKIDIVQVDAQGNEVVTEKNEGKPQEVPPVEEPAVTENIEAQEKVDEKAAKITTEDSGDPEASDAVAEVSEPTEDARGKDADAEEIQEAVEEEVEKEIEEKEKK